MGQLGSGQTTGCCHDIWSSPGIVVQSTLEDAITGSTDMKLVDYNQCTLDTFVQWAISSHDQLTCGDYIIHLGSHSISLSVTTVTPDQPFTTLSDRIHTLTARSIVCDSVSRLSLFSSYHHRLVSALSGPSIHTIT